MVYLFLCLAAGSLLLLGGLFLSCGEEGYFLVAVLLIVVTTLLQSMASRAHGSRELWPVSSVVAVPGL